MNSNFKLQPPHLFAFHMIYSAIQAKHFARVSHMTCTISHLPWQCESVKETFAYVKLSDESLWVEELTSADNIISIDYNCRRRGNTQWIKKTFRSSSVGQIKRSASYIGNLSLFNHNPNVVDIFAKSIRHDVTASLHINRNVSSTLSFFLVRRPEARSHNLSYAQAPTHCRVAGDV